MIGIVNKVSLFFAAHSKRLIKLEESIESVHPGSAVKKLKDL